MHYLLSIFGIIGSFFLLKYRERVGDMLGEADWMRKVGGIYMIVIFIGLFIFIWSVAELTGTTDMLFYPLYAILPFPHKTTPVEF